MGLTQAVKVGIYLVILTLVLAACREGFKAIKTMGVNEQIILKAKVKRENEIRVIIQDLKKVQQKAVQAPTVTDTIEVIKYVDKIIKDAEFKCNDVIELVRVRNATRACIFSHREQRSGCLEQLSIRL